MCMPIGISRRIQNDWLDKYPTDWLTDVWQSASEMLNNREYMTDCVDLSRLGSTWHVSSAMKHHHEPMTIHRPYSIHARTHLSQSATRSTERFSLHRLYVSSLTANWKLWTWISAKSRDRNCSHSMLNNSGTSLSVVFLVTDSSRISYYWRRPHHAVIINMTDSELLESSEGDDSLTLTPRGL